MTTNRHAKLYHDFFRIREADETFFSHEALTGLRSVDKVLGGRRECAHDHEHSSESDLDPAVSRPPGPPLHLVQGRHAETAGRQRAIRPLHLPHLRLPTYDQTRPQAGGPGPLTSG